MRQGRFPPLRVRIGRVWALGGRFGAFLGVFNFSEKSVLEMRAQKDAPGSVSPLRVRIDRVWALGAWFGTVFVVFRFPNFCFQIFLK